MTCTNPFKVPDWPGPELYVPCGKCVPCRVQKAQEWASRLACEMSYHKVSQFVTFTYSDEYLPKNGSVSRTTVQWLIRELRRDFPPKSIKYFCAGEYGETL